LVLDLGICGRIRVKRRKIWDFTNFDGKLWGSLLNKDLVLLLLFRELIVR